MRIRELKSELRKRLASLDNPMLEARILLSHFLSLNISELITKDGNEVKDEEMKAIFKAADERLEGRPMAYILGEKEFYGYVFHVTEDVLIPQPDTEILVETALDILKDTPTPKVLDICTGSGAIITALKMERPDMEASFSDISEKALKIAIENYKNITGETAEGREGDLFQPWKGCKFDMITANPPYVTKEWYESVSEEVKREPILAIVDEEDDGLGIIRRIIKEAPSYMKEGGHLILEADYRQHEKIRDLLRREGFSFINTQKDLSGLERISYGRMN